MTTPTDISDLSTTAASNSPAGSEVPGVLDDNLRALAAIIKQQASQGSDVASASTLALPAAGSYFDITGTTTVTAISSTNSWNGRVIYLQFDGILQLTHSANLELPGDANITTAAGDSGIFVQKSSGVWQCLAFTQASGAYITAASSDTLTNKIVNLTSNTLTGTTAQFNTALSDGSFATLAGNETLTNKIIVAANNTLTIASTDLSDTAALTYNADTSVFGNGWVVDEDTLVSNLDTKVPTQQSVKAYVDATSRGAVKQIKVATSAPGSSLTESYDDYSSVTLTSVASGSYVIVFALGDYDIPTSSYTYQIITDSSNNGISYEGMAGYTISDTQTITSIGYDATPGTGNVTYKLRAKKEIGGAANVIDNVIMVAVEYTP